MKRVTVFFAILLLLPALASADGIVIDLPSLSVESSQTSSTTVTLTATAAVTGSYNVYGYDLGVVLSKVSGTTDGVTLTGAAPASSNYFFTLATDSFLSTTAGGNPLYEHTLSTSTNETIANTTRNMITLTLTIAAGAEGVYDLSFDEGWSMLINSTGASLSGVTFTGGTITVTQATDIPEPGTLALLAAGAVGLLYWGIRRRK